MLPYNYSKLAEAEKNYAAYCLTMWQQAGQSSFLLQAQAARRAKTQTATVCRAPIPAVPARAPKTAFQRRRLPGLANSRTRPPTAPKQAMSAASKKSGKARARGNDVEAAALLLAMTGPNDQSERLGQLQTVW